MIIQNYVGDLAPYEGEQKYIFTRTETKVDVNIDFFEKLTLQEETPPKPLVQLLYTKA